MKAVRLSEDEYAATVKRIGRTQHNSGWPFPKPAKPLNANADPATHKFHAQQKNGFASTLEARRACELELLQLSNAISELRYQQRFLLIAEQRDADGKLVRPCSYIADFSYRQNGQLVVEDCKGYGKGTSYAMFVIKAKLMLERHGITVREIKRKA